MRLKECLTQGVAHANRPSSIDDNSLDRIENNQAPDTASKLSSTFVDRTQWENNYKLTENLDNDENFNLSLKQTDFSCLSPAADGQDSDPGASSGSSDSSSASSPEEGYRSLSSDTDSEGLNTHRPVVRGIVNPNYPGFQHFADQLVSPCHCDDHNNNNNNSDDPDELTINRLDRHDVKSFYDKPKFDLGDTLDTLSELVTCLNIPLKNKMATEVDNKMADAMAEEEVKSPEVEVKMPEFEVKRPEVAVKRPEFEVKRPEVDVKRPEFEVNRPEMEVKSPEVEVKRSEVEVKSPELEVKRPEVEMKSPEVGMKRLEMAVKRPEVELKRPEVVRKRDKMALNLKTGPTRRTRDRRRTPPDPIDSFDVYNIETALPTIDMDAIENHLRAAREQERRRRNDREEIRKRLATGCDAEEYLGGDRPGRKPSLQSRLQSGMNLQICFMNDTMSDTESPSSDSEHGPKGGTPTKQASPLAAHPAAIARSRAAKPPPDPPNNNIKGAAPSAELSSEADLVAVQAEARAALAQAADLARLQMEGERQRRQTSPITQIIRNALHKVGVELDADRRRVSRQMLTDMNLAQLQVIVNDLHTQIEYLNEGLVQFLMERDDLHMGQDSMLVDIEDLTRYIGAKEDVLNEDLNINNNVPAMKPKPHRMAAMRK